MPDPAGASPHERRSVGRFWALFVGLAGLAVAIWRSLNSRLEFQAQQQAEALRDIRAEQATALRGLRAEQAAALRDLRAELDARFDAINARFDSVDARFDGIDVRLDGIDARLDRMDARFDRMDTRLDRMEERQYEMAQALARLGGPVPEPVAREPAP